MPDDRVIRAKLIPPEPHRLAVERSGALGRLDDALALHGEVGLVTMPGYGRRELLARWMRRQPSGSVAWLQLDKLDDLARLFRHLVATLAQFDPAIARSAGAGDGGLEQLRDQGIPDLVSDLEALDDGFTLVVEGVHRVVDDQARMAIRGIHRYRPPNGRLVFLADDDASLDMWANDGTGQLARLTERELAYSIEQIETMYAQLDVHPTERELADVFTATRGWPLAVLLALEAALDAGEYVTFDPTGLAESPRLHRAICRPLPIELETALSDLAVVGPVTPGRFAEVTDRSDAISALERLGHRHLTVRTDGRVAVAPVVAEHVLHERLTTDRPSATFLRRRLAHALSEDGQPRAAIQVLEHAGDSEAVTRMLLEQHREWSGSGERDLVARCVTRSLVADPTRIELLLVRAWQEVLNDEDAAAAATIDHIASYPVDGDRKLLVDSELEMLRAFVARRAGRMDDCLFHAIACEEIGSRMSRPLDEPYSSVAPDRLPLYLGHCLFHAGELDDARAELLRASMSRQWNSVALSALHGPLALIGWLTGDGSATIHAAIAGSHLGAELTGSDHLAAAAFALVHVGDDADQLANRHADAVERLGEPTAVVLGHVVAAKRSTSTAEARRMLAAARTAAERCEQPGVLSLIVSRAAALLDLPDGDTTELGEELTDGERRVLLALRGDLTEREIAVELHLSHNTVRTYRRRAYRKLGVVSRAEAVRRLEELGTDAL